MGGRISGFKLTRTVCRMMTRLLQNRPQDPYGQAEKKMGDWFHLRTLLRLDLRSISSLVSLSIPFFFFSFVLALLWLLPLFFSSLIRCLRLLLPSSSPIPTLHMPSSITQFPFRCKNRGPQSDLAHYQRHWPKSGLYWRFRERGVHERRGFIFSRMALLD